MAGGINDLDKFSFIFKPEKLKVVGVPDKLRLTLFIILRLSNTITENCLGFRFQG